MRRCDAQQCAHGEGADVIPARGQSWVAEVGGGDRRPSAEARRANRHRCGEAINSPYIGHVGNLYNDPESIKISR
jgi:hypothetical protein